MKQKKNYLSLERRLLRVSHLPDIACGIILLMYTVFIMNLNFKTHYPIILIVIGGVLFAQFVLSSITNHLLMNKTSREIERWESEEFTVEERTKLFLAVHKLPKKKAIEACCYFFICAIMLAAAYHFAYEINPSINAVSLLSCFLGAYVAGLLALANSKNICNEYACKLVDQGIDLKILNKKSFFGVSYAKTFVLYCIVPVIWGVAISAALFYVYYYNNIPSPTSGFMPSRHAHVTAARQL